MRKIIGRILILMLVFLGSTTVTAVLRNSEDTDNRQAMNDPVLPEVMVDYDGILANRMYGYVRPMQADYVRDSITPLDTTRQLTFVVNPYQTGVKSLSYEIRTSDGSRVLENKKIKNLTADDTGNLRAVTEVSSDLLLNQEYSMQITLDTDAGDAYYYTRVIARSNLNTVGYLKFVRTFVEKSLDRQNVNDLMDYMEPENSSSTTNYASLDIHATQNQLGWGSLGAQMYRRGVPLIKDINETTASISIEYQVSARDEDNQQEIYDVTDFFRMRYTSARMMLLDFTRSAGQVFYPGSGSITEDGLTLGIRDRNVSSVTNAEAGITAFVQEGDLWSFSVKDGKTTRVFSFRRDEGGDFRDARNAHDIQIVRVYDNADIDFVLYGYMNRGVREGLCGVCVYHYDNDRNVIQEKVFLPSSESYEFLRRDLGKCSYVSTDDSLFLLLAGHLYKVDLRSGSFSVLEEGIDEEEFASSRSGAHAAWVLQQEEAAGSICEIDFETGNTRSIAPGEERRLRLIGFMNEDLVYGILREKDILTDENGHVHEGLRAICFETFEGELLKKYKPEKNRYITNIIPGERLLEFSIARKADNRYVELKKDNILNNSQTAAAQAQVELTTSARCGVRVRLAFTSGPGTDTPLVILARLRNSDDRMVKLPDPVPDPDMFYVYAMGYLDGFYKDPGQAVRRADELLGVVLSAGQQYIWERGNKKTSAMLNLEDIPDIMKNGTLELDVLRQELSGSGRILDLTGCTLDSVLYEISAGRPVLARTGEGTASLIVGYDEYNTWLLRPETGEVYACGMQDSTALFEKAGNVFITYLENEVKEEGTVP